MSKKKTGFPDSQAFNVSPKPNKNKKSSWWQRTPPQNNTQVKTTGVK